MKKTTFFTILIFVCFALNFSYANTLYVSTTGNDVSGNGSATSPYKTIAKAATMVNAGDTVFVAAGTYTEENITPKSSGTENAMIVFKPLTTTGDVIIKHPGTTISDNTPVFQLSNRNYIWIEGMYFKDFSYGKACVYISSGVGNVVINSRFENLGNTEVGTWDGNQMVALFNSTKNVVTNNYFKNITGDGINVNSQLSTHNLISNNTFIDFKGKLRAWGGTYLFSRAIDVQDMSNGNNVIAFNSAQNVYNAIWLDRDGSNNIILRNFGRKGSGLVFNESRCAKNVVQENISIEMNVGYMTAYYDETGWTFDPRWVNNVAYNNKTGFSVHKSWRDEFRNNIAFNNTDYNLKFTQEALNNAPHIFSNNLWFTANKTNSIQFKGNAVSVPEFQDGVRETDGLSVDPIFVSTVSGSENFNLQAGSPAKGAGDNGLDLGAFAVYPQTSFGWSTNLQTAGVQVYFDQVVSISNRGTQSLLTIKLSKASANTISVAILPVGGDALSGEDFTLSTTTVVFQPGQTSKTLSVDLNGTSNFDELVAFRLANVTNAIPGARDLHVLRVNKTQRITAYAGNNQSVWESNYSGTAEVSLDGSLSQNPFGDITSYEWVLNGVRIATGVSPTVTLPIGINSITLTVKDANGNSATDKVIITVKNVSAIWLESECGVVGSLWNSVTDNTASNDKYVTIKTGNNSSDIAAPDSNGQITYSFNVSTEGMYTIWARIIAPNVNDDSFWIQVDGGSWLNWNGITSSASWTWDDISSYNLSPGSHTLTIAYREDGAKLDKLLITNSTAPSGEGQPANNCSLPVIIQENVIGFCGVDGAILNNNTGYTGAGYADSDFGIGNGINWMVNFFNSGSNKITFRYASTSNRTANLIVNGVTVASNISFPSTGSWTTWGTVTMNVNVNSGISDVRLEATSSEGLVNIDYIEVNNATATACQDVITTIQENEAGFCSVDGTIDNNNSGFTGSGFANTTNAAGNGINWMVNFSALGSKTFTFRYAALNDRAAKLIINGVTVLSNINFPATGSWTTWNTISVNANTASGTQTVRLEANDVNGLGNIDYLEVEGGRAGICLENVNLQSFYLRNSVSVHMENDVNVNAENNVDVNTENNVIVYPNPVNNILNIAVLPGSPVTISVLNSKGQILFQETENGTNKSIDMTNFEKGIYFLRIVGDYQINVRKIIKY